MRPAASLAIRNRHVTVKGIAQNAKPRRMVHRFCCGMHHDVRLPLVEFTFLRDGDNDHELLIPVRGEAMAIRHSNECRC